jgi:hypothetical protein
MKSFAIILLLCFAVNLAAAETIQPPMPPSPIAEFRGWLKQSPEDRQLALAKRSDQSRRLIKQKLDEYSALSEAERERRLNATELQWYVTHLLKMPKARRDAAVREAPPLWQPMILERLTAWDKMPPGLQKEALDHQMVVEYLSTPASQRESMLRSLPSAERAALSERIEQWKILPAVERSRLDERVNEFFNMNRERQQRALDSFSDTDRKSMQDALDAFRVLNPQQRDLCIKAFAQFADRFAAMSRPEQIAFLKNAERWREMSPKEREMWRKVVAVVPPMPPWPVELPPTLDVPTSSPQKR